MEIKTIKDWNLGFDQEPLIIAGPCSAESEEQVMNTAKQLQKIGVNIFRAGIWKPRTRPNAFEGVGSIGFKWLARAKEETGMLIATEVANVKHVYEALKANVDIIWIGARTTANPFSMHEVANALSGVNIPVFVKNPVNPDVDLWIGAIERLQEVGLDRVGAIHRGVSSFEASKYRNIPKWQMPIELKQRIPGITLICDPSHIGGKRKLIAPLSQKAMDLNFDGLMIETHYDPKNAWTDAAQQVTPKRLKTILDELILREEHPEGVSYDPLRTFRSKIDEYDEQLLDLLKNRLAVVNDIGTYKKDNNMTILQAERWEEIISKYLKMSKKSDLSQKLIKRVFTAIHQESIRKQTKIMNG